MTSILTLFEAVDKQFPEDVILDLIKKNPSEVYKSFEIDNDVGCRGSYNVLHIACYNNAPYNVILALVREYPNAARLAGTYHASRLPVEYLFVEYFWGGGPMIQDNILNERAYYGLKGYVRRSKDLINGPWKDFWRKSSLLLVSGHRYVLPENLPMYANGIRSIRIDGNGNDEYDCYADPLLVVLVAEAIEYFEPKKGIRPELGNRGRPVKLFFDCFHEMLDRMVPLLHIDEPYIVHEAIDFLPPNIWERNPYIHPNSIVQLVEHDPSSLCRPCPHLMNLTPVTLAAMLGGDRLDLIFMLLRMDPTVCDI